MTDGIKIDRGAIRGMVEDFWRSFLSVAKSNPRIGQETILRFEERIKSTAELMPAEQAASFLRVVDEEREILFNDYQRDPEALKQKLGLTSSSVDHLMAPRQTQTVSEAIVRTAVRTTVRESIYALFRLFR